MEMKSLFLSFLGLGVWPCGDGGVSCVGMGVGKRKLIGFFHFDFFKIQNDHFYHFKIGQSQFN